MESAEKINPEWHESLFGVEIALLLAAPVYYGSGVPRGNGSGVVLIPGFMHGDSYLLLMYSWLDRLGYRPFFSQIGLNASCPNLLISEILGPVIKDAAAQTKGKIHLIGHSLGGVIARSIAARSRDIASVITLGSPCRPANVQKRIFQTAELVRSYLIAHETERVRPQCLTQECPCPFMTSLREPSPRKLPLTAIYTKNDGLIEWRSCRTGDSAIDVEVSGTHTGLAFNPAVYKVVAERLAAVNVRRRTAKSAAA